MPKPNTKIRRDSHGLYVRTNGAVYRPERTKWYYPGFTEDENGKLIARDIANWPVEGMAVRAAAVSQSPFARLQSEDGKKVLWIAHGGYSSSKDSETCWEPDADQETRRKAGLV